MPLSAPAWSEPDLMLVTQYHDVESKAISRAKEGNEPLVPLSKRALATEKGHSGPAGHPGVRGCLPQASRRHWGVPPQNSQKNA